MCVCVCVCVCVNLIKNINAHGTWGKWLDMFLTI